MDCPSDATMVSECSFLDNDYTACAHGAVYLVCREFSLEDGDNDSSGYLAYQDGMVCDTSFGNSEADLVCQVLGFEEASYWDGEQTYSSSDIGLRSDGSCIDCQGQECDDYTSWIGDLICDDGPYIFFNCEEFDCDAICDTCEPAATEKWDDLGWSLEWISCPEGAADTSDCSLEVSQSCTSGTGVFVECSGSWKLLHGDSAMSGLIAYGNGYYCGSLDEESADALCVYLGYKEMDHYSENQDTHHGLFTASELECTGTTCTWSHNPSCSWDEGVELHCLADIKLLHGTATMGVAAMNDGYVCQDDFDLVAADVICQDLGFIRGNSFKAQSMTMSGDDYWAVTDLLCPRTAKTLGDCTYSLAEGSCMDDGSYTDVWGNSCESVDCASTGAAEACCSCGGGTTPNCPSERGVFLTCQTHTQSIFDASLTLSGYLPIVREWDGDAICDEGFTQTEADYVCQDMGFTGAATFTTGVSLYWEDSVGHAGLNCTGANVLGECIYTSADNVTEVCVDTIGQIEALLPTSCHNHFLNLHPCGDCWMRFGTTWCTNDVCQATCGTCPAGWSCDSGTGVNVQCYNEGGFHLADSNMEGETHEGFLMLGTGYVCGSVIDESALGAVCRDLMFGGLESWYEGYASRDYFPVDSLSCSGDSIVDCVYPINERNDCGGSMDFLGAIHLTCSHQFSVNATDVTNGGLVFVNNLPLCDPDGGYTFSDDAAELLCAQYGMAIGHWSRGMSRPTMEYGASSLDCTDVTSLSECGISMNVTNCDSDDAVFLNCSAACASQELDVGANVMAEYTCDSETGYGVYYVDSDSAYHNVFLFPKGAVTIELQINNTGSAEVYFCIAEAYHGRCNDPANCYIGNNCDLTTDGTVTSMDFQATLSGANTESMIIEIAGPTKVDLAVKLMLKYNKDGQSIPIWYSWGTASDCSESDYNNLRCMGCSGSEECPSGYIAVCDGSSLYHCEEGEFTIEHNATEHEGLLKFHDGYVCADSFGNSEAKATCRIMGYPGGYRCWSASRSVGADFSMGNLECPSWASSMDECRRYDTATHLLGCDSSEGIWLDCLAFTLEGKDGYYSGILYYKNGPVCSAGFTMYGANFVCVDMGFARARTMNTMKVDEGASEYTIETLSCPLDAQVMSDCSVVFNDGRDCTSGLGIYIECEMDVDILPEDENLETVISGVCSEGFGDNEATAVCVEAGYVGFVNYSNAAGYIPAETCTVYSLSCDDGVYANCTYENKRSLLDGFLELVDCDKLDFSGYEDLIGDGNCDSRFDCKELAYDAGDCVVILDFEFREDCDGNEVDWFESIYLGDGTCDDGSNSMYPNFACDLFSCDSGDCCCDDDCPTTAPTAALIDCNGDLQDGKLYSWIGDHICDSIFNCDKFNCDQGDCACDGGDVTENAFCNVGVSIVCSACGEGNCDDGEYFTGDCEELNHQCETCSADNCAANYYYVEDECSGSNDGCVACNITNCDQCISSRTCGDCSSGYYLSSSTCVECSAEACNSINSYLNSSSCTGNFNGCHPCSSLDVNCNLCSYDSLFSCDDCLLGYYQLTKGDECVSCGEDNCNSEEYYDSTSCYGLHNGCLPCSGADSANGQCLTCDDANTCTSCVDPYVLEEVSAGVYVCLVDCSPDNCNTGTYYDADQCSLLSDGCMPCYTVDKVNSKCATCSSASQCDTCENGYQLTSQTSCVQVTVSPTVKPTTSPSTDPTERSSPSPTHETCTYTDGLKMNTFKCTCGSASCPAGMICDAASKDEPCLVMGPCGDQSGLAMISGQDCWCGNDMCQAGEFCTNSVVAISLCRSVAACSAYGVVIAECACGSEIGACPIGYMCRAEGGCQQPTSLPTSYPSRIPTSLPSGIPSYSPTDSPTLRPTTPNPSRSPTMKPISRDPSPSPYSTPSRFPTATPSQLPTRYPTGQPTATPLHPTPTYSVCDSDDGTVAATIPCICVEENDEVCMVNEYCTRVEISVGGAEPGFKCSQYPYCENQSGLVKLTDTCACGHNKDSHDDVFEFRNCNAGSYCSGDGQFTYSKLQYQPGDLRCAAYPDAKLSLVFDGLTISNAQDSASSVEHVIQDVMKSHLQDPSNIQVIYEDSTYSSRRRLGLLVVKYRISPMETQDAEVNLLDALASEIEGFLSAVNSELSSTFEKEITVTGLTIGDQEVYNDAEAAGSRGSSPISITMILVIGVGLLAVLLMCFIACKMRENKRLREEMLKEEGTVNFNQDFSDSQSQEAVFVQEFGEDHRPTPYSPSSSGPSPDEGGAANRYREAMGTLDHEEGETTPKKRKHASKSSRSMRLITAGAFGECSSPSGGEYEMTEIDKRKSGEKTPSSELPPKAVFHLPMTPPKVISPTEVQPMDAIALPIHTSGGPLGSELSEGRSIYGRPNDSRSRGVTGEASVEQRRDYPRKKGNLERSDFKSDQDNAFVTVPLGDEYIRSQPDDKGKSGMGTNI